MRYSAFSLVGSVCRTDWASSRALSWSSGPVEESLRKAWERLRCKALVMVVFPMEEVLEATESPLV